MEEPVIFSNGDQQLRGVLHAPDDGCARADTGIVFLHGWSGSRLGPHRMFVKTARELTDLGCTCLRFDFRGRGESDGETIRATIQTMIDDTACAVNFLCRKRPVEKLLLLGICSGGKVAIGAAAADPRVNGLALWSAEPLGELKDPDINTRKSVSAVRKYAAKAMRFDTWRRLLSGRVNVGLVKKAVLQHESSDKEELVRESALLKRFRRYRGRVCFVYGTNDPTTTSAAENYAGFCRRCGIENEFHRIDGANHSFYSLQWERQVMDLTRDWVTRHFT